MLGASQPNFPRLLSITDGAFATAASSHPVPMPAAVTAGDLLLMTVSTRAVSGSNAIPTTPSGWTQLNIGATGAGSVNYTAVYYKTAAGTEGGTTVSVATASSTTTLAAQTHRIQVGTFTGPPTAAGVSDTGANMTPDPPSLDSGVTTVKLWIAGFGSNGDAAPLTWPLPDNQRNTPTGGVNPVRINSCTTLSGTQILNPAAFSMGANTRWRAYTVAIKPN